VAELVVRMGEIAATQHAGDVLVGLGLGSCIGLVLVEDRGSVAAMAHVVLPESNGKIGTAGKFADTAIPQLIHEITSIGANRSRLSAVLVGGAQMFALGGSGAMDIGMRNETAVRALLGAERIPVVGAATGGSRGRTIRVHPGGGVLSKEAGGAEIELMRGDRP
jgi:chemotaxis protein CheD